MSSFFEPGKKKPRPAEMEAGRGKFASYFSGAKMNVSSRGLRSIGVAAKQKPAEVSGGA